MPNTREKLIELMTAFYGVDPMYYGVEAHPLADHLIANGVTVQKWIPVTERLPERNTEVLVYTGTTVFSHTFFATESMKYSCVTHWMPLPEPPKGE